MKIKNISVFRFINVVPSFFLLSFFQCSESYSPGNVVENFYSTYLKTTASGLPNEKDFLVLKPFFTSKLDSLFMMALKKQKDFTIKFPEEKPPLIEGNLFSSLFEGPSTFKIANSKVNEDSATVFVEFTYSDSSASENPLKWQDAVYLVIENGKWKISDVEYLGKWDFSPSWKLTEILNSESGN